MQEIYREDVIFVITKHDVLVCCNELGIPEERVTDDVIELVKREIGLSFDNWPEVIKSTLIEAFGCPLGLVCYPSCFWWKDGKCTFLEEKKSRISKSKNPYPESLIDEASGIEVTDIRHQIWAEGYQAGEEDRQSIKTVVKSQNGMVMVFDNMGEQISEYQGQYEDVKEGILKDAPLNAVFGSFPNCEIELKVVPREEW